MSGDPVADLIANGGGRPKHGTIGVISAERASYTAFWNSLHRQHLAMLAQNPRTSLITAMGANIPQNCNQLCRRTEGDWLWVMGDDHVWEPDLLPRLLAHNVDVVVPHCLKRNPGWESVAYSHQDDDGFFVSAELPESELTEIHAAGSAGMLIRRHVLDAIGDPWFTPSPGAVGLDEDLHFCQKVREAGFRIYCDPSTILGHISHYTIQPRWSDEDGWQLEAVFDQRERMPIKRLAEVPA